MGPYRVGDEGKDICLYVEPNAPSRAHQIEGMLWLIIPRRASPRTAVPPGSVAVANRQSVLYPSRLPGGWNIIGATPLSLFDPARTPSTLMQPGDRVRFVPIDATEFDRLREAKR